MQTNISENEKIERQKEVFERIVVKNAELKRMPWGYSEADELHIEIERLAKENELMCLEPNQYSGNRKQNDRFEKKKEKLGIITVNAVACFATVGSYAAHGPSVIFPPGSCIVAQRNWRRDVRRIGRTTKIQLPIGKVIRYIESKIPEYAEYVCGHFLL